MEELYSELLEREEYLKSLEQTEQVRTRLGELTLIIVRVQQLLLPIVSSTFVCEHPKRQRDYYSDTAYKCWKCKKIVVAN